MYSGNKHSGELKSVILYYKTKLPNLTIETQDENERQRCFVDVLTNYVEAVRQYPRCL